MTGEPTPTDVRPLRVHRVRLGARQPQHHPRRGPPRARIVASRRRRRGARARVAQYQGSEALGGALRCSAWFIRTSLIEPSIWELPTPSSPNRQPSGDATFRVIASTASLTRTCGSHRMEPESHSALEGRATARCGCRTATDPRRTRLTNFEGGERVGSPAWSADGKSIAFDTRRRPLATGISIIVAADGRPRQTADVRRVQQHLGRVGLSRPVDLLCIRSHRRLADLEDAIVRREARTDHLGGRQGSRSSRGTADASTTPSRRLSWASGRSRPREARKFRSSSAGAEMLNFDVAENGIFMMDRFREAAGDGRDVQLRLTADRSGCAAAAGRAASASLLPSTRDGRSMLYTRGRFVDERHRDAARVSLKTNSSRTTPARA